MYFSNSFLPLLHEICVQNTYNATKIIKLCLKFLFESYNTIKKMLSF